MSEIRDIVLSAMCKSCKFLGAFPCGEKGCKCEYADTLHEAESEIKELITKKKECYAHTKLDGECCEICDNATMYNSCIDEMKERIEGVTK